MFDSSQYNLSHPALTEDIGYANLNRMLPMAPSTFGGSMGFITGVTGTMNGITMRGSLLGDKVEIESQKEKDKRIWKTVFKVAAVAIGGLLCWKFGKPYLTKAWNGIKTLPQKIKNLFKKP